MSKDVIIACDFNSKADLMTFLDKFENEDRKPFLKVGMELFYAEGPAIVKEIKARGHKIFLDLKLHDIPNTVKKAMAVLSALDVDICNLHAAGTAAMMEAALEGLTRADGTRPLLIAVTQLTSTSEERMQKDLLIDRPLDEVVMHYAKNAKDAGLDGVVCSPLEAGKVKAVCGDAFLTVTPGVRFADGEVGDQVRVTTPAKARELGAEGIGLCRTEHMFFEGDRIKAMREMILANTEEGRRAALDKLLPIQRADFQGIFEAMDGLGVTIRLLDPPLHEFVPHQLATQKELANEMGITVEEVKSKCDSLEEFNPMLGHRGCRLGNTYPEITEMQARAIIEAAIDCKEKGIDVHPEIMVPLVGVVKELEMQSEIIRRTAEKVFAERGTSVAYKIGTMIEVPRAALVADKIAEYADFFSFGTNDLTQMTFGYSRDDAPKFLKYYKELGIIKTDPFEVLDQEGVGQLVEMGTKKGRSTKAGLKVGICGEHGGEPSSVKFCAKLGMNYVSCSPFRVPIARVAAAQAAVEE